MPDPACSRPLRDADVSVLTMGMGNEAMTGTVYADVLWSLALLLLAMSLVFIMPSSTSSGTREAAKTNG